MLPTFDHWVDNSGVRLHYVDSEGNSGVSIVIVPGVSESADDYADVIASFSGIRCVVVTFRGRGRSASPKEGYSLQHHIEDIEKVVEDAKLGRFCLVGISRGVAYAVAFAIRHPQMVSGLVIGDYPPRQTRLPEGWADWFWTTSWRGKPVSDRMTREAVVGIQRDSEDVPLSDDLSKLDCPVLVLKGGQKGSALSQEETDRIKHSLKRAEILVFERAGHDLRSPDQESFIKAILSFCARIPLLR